MCFLDKKILSHSGGGGNMTNIQSATLDELHKRENKKVAAWLLYYEERKIEYEKLREEILLKAPSGPASACHQEAYIADPTGRKVEQLSKLKETEEWIKLIEDVEKKLPWKLQVVLRLRREARHRKGYSRGRPAWIPYVQHRYCREIAMREGKNIEDAWVNSPDTFTTWWNKIVEYTAREASKRGLL